MDQLDSIGRRIEGEIYRRGAFGHRPRYLIAELDITVALTGCATLGEIDRTILPTEAR